MFLLKIIFQNSVSTCIKNICPLSILLLVSICIWWNRKFVVQSAGTEKKNWPSEVGKKIFGMPNHSREREPCNVPSPYPPWHITYLMCRTMAILLHHMCNVPTRSVPRHMTYVMCHR